MAKVELPDQGEILLEIPDEPQASDQTAPEKQEPPRREQTLLPTKRKQPAAVVPPPATTETAESETPATITVPKPTAPSYTMSSNNQQKLRQAILHLTRYFHLADDEQIEGRKFFGETTITVKWRNGQAQMILPRMEQSDNGTRDGR